MPAELLSAAIYKDVHVRPATMENEIQFKSIQSVGTKISLNNAEQSSHSDKHVLPRARLESNSCIRYLARNAPSFLSSFRKECDMI
jgi:hypothetical protein